MSLWGKSESQLAGSGTVAINLGTGVVTGTNSTFSAAMVGSVITVGTAGTCGEAVIISRASNTSISVASTQFLIPDGGAGITGIAYTVTQKPKSTLGDVNYQISEIYGVDTTEQTVANAASGEARKYAPPHAGWVGIQTYNDMHGNFRVKSETLVASSSITGDAADDAKFPDS
tara:strand:+ start:642 stop:1160 length:519 start_codon:yes stop_codon:yes gene_type:complete